MLFLICAAHQHRIEYRIPARNPECSKVGERFFAASSSIVSANRRRPELTAAKEKLSRTASDLEIVRFRTQPEIGVLLISQASH